MTGEFERVAVLVLVGEFAIEVSIIGEYRYITIETIPQRRFRAEAIGDTLVVVAIFACAILGSVCRTALEMQLK